MLNSKSVNNLLLVLVIMVVVVVSMQTLTTKPGVWVDEAKSILLARSFANHYTLDIETSPGEYSGAKTLLQSSGYPVTVPLAGVFEIFGDTFVNARIYMLSWMCLALVMIYFFVRKLSDSRTALLSTLLVATFASFHDSGRTVVGEIPGFVFLLAGLYLWLEKREFIGAGFFLSLALVVKPSVFLSLIPAVLLIVLVGKSAFKNKLSKIIRMIFGGLPPALFWLTFSVDKSDGVGIRRNVLEFFANPYSTNSILDNILKNLSGVIHSSTLIYFGVLLVIAIFAYRKIIDEKLRALFLFTFIYSAFTFLYYLRSPGWLRYILISELLLLIITPITFSHLAKFWKYLTLALVTIQTVHFFTAAQIQYSDSAIIISDKIGMYESDKKIGIVNALEVSALLPSAKIYQTVHLLGIPTIGEHPLSKQNTMEPPDLILTGPGFEKSWQMEVIEEKYELAEKHKGYGLYLRRSSRR